MKQFAYISILVLVTTTAFSANPIREEADLKANGRLDVSNVAGTVEITGWSQKKIEVTGELGEDSKLIFDVDGDTARIEVEFDNKKGKWKRHNRESTDLYIRVPHSTRVSATTVSADLTVSEIRGAQRLQTVSGDVETHLYDEEVVVKTVSGEIDFTGESNRIRLTVATVSGDIDGEDAAGDITAKSVSGDIDLVAKDFSQLRLDTVSGDLDFRGKMDVGGRIDAESVSGDIVLDIHNLHNAEYFLETFSGDIRPILGYRPIKTSKYAPGSRLEMVEGDGKSRIRVETMSGDIEITGSSKGKPQVRQTSGLSQSDNEFGRHRVSDHKHDFGQHMEALDEHMEKMNRTTQD